MDLAAVSDRKLVQTNVVSEKCRARASKPMFAQNSFFDGTTCEIMAIAEWYL